MKRTACLTIGFWLIVTGLVFGQTHPSRLGINLAGLTDWSTEFIWVDIMTCMRVEEMGDGFPSGQYDTNGYPLFLNPGQEIHLGFGAGTDYAWPEGFYHVFHDGRGTLTGRTDNETLIRDDGNGHQIWEIKHQNPWFGFALTATDPDNHLRNLHIIMPGFEETWRTDPIHPSFRDHWQGFEAFRFMDTMGINGSPVEEWQDMKPSGFITQQSDDGHGMTDEHWGTSPAILIELCNQMQKDAWFCLPHRATDDCMLKFAALVRDCLDPDLKVYIEYSNEFWNWGFEQTGYCADQGRTLGIGDGGSLEYAVTRSGQMYALWESVFGMDSDRVINVFSWQAVDDYWWPIAIDVYFKDPVVNPSGSQPEFFAIAPYFTDTTVQENWTLDDLFAGADALPPHEINIPWQVENMIRKQKSCDERGIEFGCYEAGQHYVEPVNISIEANRDPRMGSLYERYLNAWRDHCGGLMMLYSSCGLPGLWGSWGTLERWDQDTSDAHKYRAAQAFVGASASRDTEAPEAPTGLSATGLTETAVDLHWTSSWSADVIGYKIYNGPFFVQSIVGADVSHARIEGLIPGGTYLFTVRANDRAYNLSDPSNEVTVTVSGAAWDADAGRLREYFLNQNYPNPFNHATLIRYGLPESEIVKVILYNSMGQEVTTLVDQRQAAGDHEIRWDARDCPSGLYVLRIEAGSYHHNLKMVLLK